VGYVQRVSSSAKSSEQLATAIKINAIKNMNLFILDFLLYIQKNELFRFKVKERIHISSLPEVLVTHRKR